MARTISIAIQKGGSGKTTTAVNLAASLKRKGKRVLLIDMDPQANATFSSGINTTDLENSTYNLLTADSRYRCSASDAVIPLERYDIIPADKDVSDLREEEPKLKDTELRTCISDLDSSYDYIIIDTPPELGRLTVNALVASDFVIIPAEPQAFNYTGMIDFQEAVNTVQKSRNKKLKILGVLFIRCGRTSLDKDMIDLFRKNNLPYFETTIHAGVAVGKSHLAQLPLVEYQHSSRPSMDYMQFAGEVLQRIGDR